MCAIIYYVHNVQIQSAVTWHQGKANSTIKERKPPLVSVSLQFDMQRITLEELKHILFYAFRDHLTMKDIENIIINEEESLKENSGNCQTEFEGGELRFPCRQMKRERSQNSLWLLQVKQSNPRGTAASITGCLRIYWFRVIQGPASVFTSQSNLDKICSS